MSTPESRRLEVPAWVPGLVTALAQTLYPEAVTRPTVLAGGREGPPIDTEFGKHAEALRRVTTDARMRAVWRELFKRQGGAERGDGPFVHLARLEMVRSCPQYQGLAESFPKLSDEYDPQDQAAAVLFLVATGHSLWDRRFEFGPRTRTRASFNAEVEALFNLAARHDDDAAAYDRLGMYYEAQSLRGLATAARSQAELRRPKSNDPWVVERTSGRVGDDWDRGLIIEIAQTCESLFGERLLATVAAVANVVLDRADITKGKVQGVLKRAP